MNINIGCDDVPYYWFQMILLKRYLCERSALVLQGLILLRLFRAIVQQYAYLDQVQFVL